MKKRLLLAGLMLVLTLGLGTALGAADQNPVRIDAPEKATLGEKVEISWAITDDSFVYDEAQVLITESRERFRAFRDEDQELSGRSGMVQYTPTAGDTLRILFNFMDSEYEILYSWEQTFELTGTPTYDLRMADGTVDFCLNKETKELEARFELSGGNGSFERMEYIWDLYPEGGSNAEFYQEGRMDLEGSSGMLTLLTTVPGRYSLMMNLYDESGWIKRIDNQGFSFTVSAAEGDEEVSAEVLPAELFASEEEQELTWKVRGGYTPFYHCDVNLQILDPSGEPLYSEATECQTVGTVQVLLQTPGAYSAVFHITTCDKDGNDVELDPITVPFTVSGMVPDPNRIGDNVTYTLDLKTGSLIISGTGPMYDFDNEEPPPWHDERDSIKTVTVKEGVTRIGDYVLCGCSSLQTVTMAGVKEIGACAFEECAALERVVFSGQLERIDMYAFGQCTALTSITLPASLKRIGWAAFAECGLRQIVVEGNTKTWHFFYDTDSGFELYHIDLPAGLEEVDEGAFYSNPLQRDTPDFVPPSTLHTIEDEAFEGIAARFVWLSDNVRGIGDAAFAGCPNLEFVYIPYDCQSLGEGVFPRGTILLGISDEDRDAYAESNGLIWIIPENPFGGNG